MSSKLASMHLNATVAMQHSYSPYSKFKVGVSILSEDGQIFSGTNIENVSYGLTLCAEATAIASMMMAGCREIKEVVVIGNNSQVCTPCGACRQRIREFATDDVLIHCGNLSGIKKTFNLGELLPHSFNTDNFRT